MSNETKLEELLTNLTNAAYECGMYDDGDPHTDHIAGYKEVLSVLRKSRSELTEFLDASNKEKAQLIQSLLNKVNRVTAAHRHGIPVREEDLTTLSNRQIDVERELEKWSQ